MDSLDELLSIPDPVPYAEQMRQKHAEQTGHSRAQIRESLESEVDERGHKVFEDIFDPETAVAPAHNWVDRGLIMSCEGAGHPNHRHFKVKKRR